MSNFIYRYNAVEFGNKQFLMISALIVKYSIWKNKIMISFIQSKAFS